ncbi:hypothetical protein AB3662_37605 [Sorangium cellulosum]|uniref:hypothetical protein n=1 Tax=Sorangium cellulosum TaxID=56 RepID=UPI003D9AB194
MAPLFCFAATSALVTGCVASEPGGPDEEVDTHESAEEVEDVGDSAAELEQSVALDAKADAALAACQLYAGQPYWLPGAIYSDSWWSDCPASASITVVLRHDRWWWPDRTLASRSGRGSFGSIQLSYPCGTDFNPIKVFTEVRYRSQKVQSPRAILPCG